MKRFILALSLLCVACVADTSGDLPNNLDTSRFTVSHEWQLEGRDLFVITDTQTGHEYLAYEGRHFDVAITPLLDNQ